MGKSGAIVSLYNAGQAIGGLSAGYLGERLSRKYTIWVAALLSESSTFLTVFNLR